MLKGIIELPKLDAVVSIDKTCKGLSPQIRAFRIWWVLFHTQLLDSALISSLMKWQAQCGHRHWEISKKQAYGAELHWSWHHNHMTSLNFQGIINFCIKRGDSAHEGNKRNNQLELVKLFIHCFPRIRELSFSSKNIATQKGTFPHNENPNMNGTAPGLRVIYPNPGSHRRQPRSLP